MKSEKKTAFLDQWGVGPHVNQLNGECWGHPNPGIPNGVFVVTSKIVNLDIKERLCETENTIYKLGERKDPPTFVPQPEFSTYGATQLTEK